MPAIEVILKKPVEGLGAEADVVKVKPGYARNFLIPRDIATVATSASKKMMEELKRVRAEREAEEMNAAQKLAGELKKLTLTFQVKTAAEDKIFGSISATDIAARLETLGHKIERRKIQLAHPIKDLGSHSVTVKLAADIEATIKVNLENTEAEQKTEAVAKGKGDKRKKSAKAADSEASESAES
jgi:large subunit ribosomal protein L9